MIPRRKILELFAIKQDEREAEIAEHNRHLDYNQAKLAGLKNRLKMEIDMADINKEIKAALLREVDK